MGKKGESKREELARLEEDLAELKATLPEHCYGSRGYIGVHHATPAHWQKIEDIEGRIGQLRAELGAGA